MDPVTLFAAMLNVPLKHTRITWEDKEVASVIAEASGNRIRIDNTDACVDSVARALSGKGLRSLTASDLFLSGSSPPDDIRFVFLDEADAFLLNDQALTQCIAEGSQVSIAVKGAPPVFLDTSNFTVVFWKWGTRTSEDQRFLRNWYLEKIHLKVEHCAIVENRSTFFMTHTMRRIIDQAVVIELS